MPTFSSTPPADAGVQVPLVHVLVDHGANPNGAGEGAWRNPVMAALVESDVKNLNFGHADSVGFFQMRVGIWNQGEYEGYPEKPGLQAKWFIDTALAVKKQRIAGGDVDFGKDASG